LARPAIAPARSAPAFDRQRRGPYLATATPSRSAHHAPTPDRTIRKPLVATVVPSVERLPRPVRSGKVVFFADRERRTWAVREGDTSYLADARRPRCLLFESEHARRRVFHFPADRALLLTELLIALASAR
jgi:hypothetical protein